MFDYEIPNLENVDTTIQNEEDNTQLRCSSRQRRTFTYLENFQSLPTANTVSTRYPTHKFISYYALSPSFKNTILSISSTSEPHSYNEASKHAWWKQAMQEELNALNANNT